MQTVESIKALRERRHEWRDEGKRVGFVPTMGNLHDGHLKLVKKAAETCDVVIASIFVNPLQFGQNEDLATYPRTLAEDKKKLTAQGADLLFLPTIEEMYPRGLEQQTFVEVPGISSIICGASRPGHFRGVATVVCKLFNMVQPDCAFFGQKDYQQLQVIRLMAQDLSMDLDICGVATQRASDGLALSSRNGYLNDEQRKLAPMLYKTMQDVADKLHQGDTNLMQLSKSAVDKLSQYGFKPDYIEIRNGKTLQAAASDDKHLVILAAAYLGTTRLIDNLEVFR
ncbi:pantoate--beta-alanine ligase [Salinimonas sp. HHU 13199]|uniref:Pantothenate synthetase n=1 Tax=Salinimonas profundi TaxID=2729140 RepID=A0ABR8LN84_9ALTE|nr:pantoate--beta-alanine ligase [Salinimonas profundi]MBD3587033.1 pantoate--beta-alanine ligase [Salinimonas profundi]